MTSRVENRRFVDELLHEVIQPGIERLMEGSYFTGLRRGTLSVRQLQGFAIQHYMHNLTVLKGFALSALKNAHNDDVFVRFAWSLDDELTHPNMAKKFGLSLGLTEEDFATALPIYECVAHTGAILHGMLVGDVAQNRTSALTNESMVQRYAEEFDTYLRRNYGVAEDAMEFFVVHKGADIEHTARSADLLAQLVTTEQEERKIRHVAQNMVEFKLAKFEGIFQRYA